jgi:hypothetical protein
LGGGGVSARDEDDASIREMSALLRKKRSEGAERSKSEGGGGWF